MDIDFDAAFEDRKPIELPVEFNFPDAPISVDPPDVEALGAFRDEALSADVAIESARDDAHPFVAGEQLALVQGLHEERPADLDEWERRDSGPHNPISGNRYRETNALYLASEASRWGYEDTRRLTLAQAIDVGARLRDGERGTRVLYWIFDGEFGPLECPRLVTAVVLNAEQFEEMRKG